MARILCLSTRYLGEGPNSPSSNGGYLSQPQMGPVRTSTPPSCFLAGVRSLGYFADAGAPDSQLPDGLKVLASRTFAV